MDRSRSTAQREISDAAFADCSNRDLLRPSGRSLVTCSDSRMDQEVRDPIAVRKVQKADREKLRRDRLNEQFLELGKALDPERPKNDKATILVDTIQMLKDFTAQVSRLKAEYAALSKESHEVTQEKNELKQEKAALKSDIDNLNSQYQRLRVMFPWAGMDHSVVIGPHHPYPFPMPFPYPSAPIAIHPAMQPYPVLQNQRSVVNPNPCSTCSPSCHPRAEHPSDQHIPSHPPRSSNRSHNASQQDSREQSSGHQEQSCAERNKNLSEVETDLRLKTPGSAASSSHSQVAGDQEFSSKGRKGKQRPPLRKESCISDRSSSSRFSSTSVLPESSSSTVEDDSVTNK